MNDDEEYYKLELSFGFLEGLVVGLALGFLLFFILI